MSNEKGDSPKWIPAYLALSRLRKQYEAAEIFANDEICVQAATDTLIRRLRSGQLPSRASSYKFFEEFAPDDESPPRPQDADGYYTVPSSFWAALASCNHLSREEDWVAGDFEYRHDEAYNTHEGSVIGLELDGRKLPVAHSELTEPNGSSERKSFDGKSGGRPAAKWWADFAEELVVYVYENGLPEGVGHDGQSELIDAIFARMTEQGKTEGGRGTVQPVINAVLDRLRSAKN